MAAVAILGVGRKSLPFLPRAAGGGCATSSYPEALLGSPLAPLCPKAAGARLGCRPRLLLWETHPLLGGSVVREGCEVCAGAAKGLLRVVEQTGGLRWVYRRPPWAA